jgi:hypothetical protein
VTQADNAHASYQVGSAHGRELPYGSVGPLAIFMPRRVISQGQRKPVPGRYYGDFEKLRILSRSSTCFVLIQDIGDHG